MSLNKIIQEFICPEALYWKEGDLILSGKGDHAWYFRVVGKRSPVIALIRYVRRAKDMRSKCPAI
jgi:hypothetical protein